MKIVLASSSSGSRGGGEIFLLYLAEGLRELGHQPTLWTARHPRMDELAAAFTRFGPVVRSEYHNTYDSRRRTFDVFFSGGRVRRIAEEWNRLAPDVVHVNKQNLEDGLDLLRAADATGRPAVATVHITQSARFLGARFAAVRDAIAARELRRFRGALAAIQEPRAAELRALTGDRANIHAVANGVPDLASPAAGFDRAAFRAAHGVSADDLLFVCVARLTEQKDPQGFLDAAKRLRARYPRARFCWIGDGDWRARWPQAVAERGLADVVRHVGWQSDVRPWLHAADVYLHFCRYESFLPLAVLEAMSAARPVLINETLARDVPLLRERAPFVLTETDAANVDLANAAERAAWGARGRAVYLEDFSIPAMARRYLQLYARAGAVAA